MKHKKKVNLAIMLLVSALLVATMPFTSSSLKKQKQLSGLAVGGEIELLTLGDDIQAVIPDSLVVEREEDGDYDIIRITKIPPEYMDSIKTLMVVKPGTQIDNINSSDIIALDQAAEISQAVLNHIDAQTGSGTYTVLMGGSEGNVYTGTFKVEALEPTPTVTAEPTPTATAEPTPTATVKPTPTATVKPTPTATVESTPTSTIEPTPTVTAKPTPTVTVKPTPTATVKSTPTPTIKPTPTATMEPTPTKTAKPIPTATAAPTPTSAINPTPTATIKPTPTETAKPMPTATTTPTPMSTIKPTPTETAKPTPTETVRPSTTTEVKPIPTSSSAPQNEDTIKPIGEYSDEVIIDIDGSNLVISPKDGSILPNLTLYTAIYNDDNTLIRVTMTECKADERGVLVPIEPPIIQGNQYYKLMIWDNKRVPVTNVISNE